MMVDYVPGMGASRHDNANPGSFDFWGAYSGRQDVSMNPNRNNQRGRLRNVRHGQTALWKQRMNPGMEIGPPTVTRPPPATDAPGYTPGPTAPEQWTPEQQAAVDAFRRSRSGYQQGPTAPEQWTPEQQAAVDAFRRSRAGGGTEGGDKSTASNQVQPYHGGRPRSQTAYAPRMGGVMGDWKERFNNRGTSTASRANLTQNQLPTWQQRMAGAKRWQNNPGPQPAQVLPNPAQTQTNPAQLGGAYAGQGF